MIERRGISGSTGCTVRPSWTWIGISHRAAMAGTRNYQLAISRPAISPEARPRPLSLAQIPLALMLIIIAV